MSTNGRYTALAKVADGGMAEIFLAVQRGGQGFERKVILKRVRAQVAQDADLLKALHDEARIAMGLAHSNIAQVLDVGEAQGRTFLVLELVDGWSLSQLMRRGAQAQQPLPLGLSLFICAQLCRALAHAHGFSRDGRPLNIVHRDLSPQNVLISSEGEVKLTDFGIAWAETREVQTKVGLVKGKPAYMSPEQARAEPLDGRSDLFSLGVMLYELATGARPFRGANDYEVLLKVQGAKFEPPLTQAPRLSPKVASIITKAMKKHRDERYRSADAMLADLEKVQRAAFGGAGQTELKAWLRDLSGRDGQLRISERVSAPLPEIGSAELICDVALSAPSLQAPGSPPPFPAGLSAPSAEPLPPRFSAAPPPSIEAAPSESRAVGKSPPGQPERRRGSTSNVPLATLAAAELHVAASSPPRPAPVPAGSPPSSRPPQASARRWPLALGAVLVLAGGWAALNREAVSSPEQARGSPPAAQLSVTPSPGASPGPALAPPALTPEAGPSTDAGLELASATTPALPSGNEVESLEADASVGSVEEVALAEPEPSPPPAPALATEAPPVPVTVPESTSAPEPAPGSAPAPTPVAGVGARSPPSVPAARAAMDASASRSVHIVSVPPGASVRVEKTTFGTTPINLKFHAGVTFALVFSLKGYDDLTHRFLVQPSPGQVVTVRLAKRTR